MPKDPVGAELLYLSWGVRWMGTHPIPLAMHEGWVYAVVLEGNPTLRLKDAQCPCQRGDVFVFHPDCAFGWGDQQGRASRIMTWLWRHPPGHSKITPAAGKCCQLKVDNKVLRSLVAIHKESLREVWAVGELGLLSLRRARIDLDICLVRALGHPEQTNCKLQLSMALSFLRHHPGTKHPVKELCEHLNLTPTALSAFFQRHCRRGPQAVALDIRMHYARQRLTRDFATVKEVAYELGYRHANDLSRAYREYFGASVRKQAR